MKTREEILAMTDAEREAYSREWLAAEHANIAEQFTAEVADIKTRKGELPKRELAELQQLREQIEQARAARTTAKDSLVALRTATQAEKDQFQIDLAAATKAAERQAIRAKIDACNAKLEQARIDLDAADQTLEGLRQEREEIQFQERLSKNELTAEDAPEVTRRKERQAKDANDRLAWLAKR